MTEKANELDHYDELMEKMFALVENKKYDPDMVLRVASGFFIHISTIFAQTFVKKEQRKEMRDTLIEAIKSSWEFCDLHESSKKE